MSLTTVSIINLINEIEFKEYLIRFNTFHTYVPMAPKAHELMHVQEETKEVNVEAVNEALPFYMLFSYADTLDWTLLALGTFGSIIHAMAQPVGYLLLGKALNAFGDNISDIDAMVKALKQVCIYIHKLHETSLKF